LIAPWVGKTLFVTARCLSAQGRLIAPWVGKTLFVTARCLSAQGAINRPLARCLASLAKIGVRTINISKPKLHARIADDGY
jgi:hypothetical protein